MLYHDFFFYTFLNPNLSISKGDTDDNSHLNDVVRAYAVDEIQRRTSPRKKKAQQSATTTPSKAKTGSKVSLSSERRSGRIAKRNKDNDAKANLNTVYEE